MNELLIAANKGTVVKDPYFKNTTLLLTGQQGNTSQQNNLFLDSGARFTATITGTTMDVSAVAAGTLRVGHSIFIAGVALGITITALGNGTGGTGTYTVSASQTVSTATSMTSGFNITRNPATGPNAPTQGTFSPFSQTGWGNYFSGSSQYLSFTDTSNNLDLGGSQASFECWVYPISTTNYQILFKYGGTGDWNTTNGIEYGLSLQSGVVYFYYNSSASAASINSGATTVSANTWTHIAVASNASNALSIYVNGTRVATTTAAITKPTTRTSMRIGVDISNYANGYMSNYRFITGSNAYDATLSSINVPTSPVSAVTGTQLLTCQSNRFRDASTNNFTITVNGSPSVQAFSPFNPTASWSAATYGGSGYFDGSGDYLVVPSNSVMNFGTGDFTIEAWVYPTATPGDGAGPIAGATGDILLGYQSAVPSWGFGRNFVAWDYLFNQAPILNTWQHLAVSRSGTTLRLFFNGALVNTATNSTSYNLTNASNVGFNGSTGYLTGYITNIRAVKGTAVYTAAFTPPTSPLTAITNTTLLLNFTNAGIYDATSKNDLETVGNAQISNTTAKFGSTSMSFDGTGDYLTSSPATTDMYAFGSGDFTIEFWMYISVLGTNVPYDQRTTGGSGATSTLYITSSTLRYYVSGSDRITSSTLSTGQWYHVAVARSGTSTKMFINGTQAGSTYTDSTVYTNSSLRPFIGGDSNNPGANGFNGYMQDVRVTKGYARYTANFTPPTVAFPTL